MVLNLARHDVISLYCSPAILREFSRTLKGKKFGLSNNDIDSLVGEILSFTLPGQDSSISLPHLRDSKDLFLCSLAVGSQADYLVTGDKDLLVLRNIKKTRVLTARVFLEIEFPELLGVFEQGG
jgi:uncharacterized protein